MKPPDTVVRPPAEIVADIVRELRPLKPGCRGAIVTAAILTILKEGLLQRAAQTKSPDAAAKKTARRLALALDAFGKKFPHYGKQPWFWQAEATASAMVYGQGPDPRFDFLACTCAMLARTLVTKFSRRNPVKSENGNLHLIMKLLMEAAGRPHAGGLRAVKALPPPLSAI